MNEQLERLADLIPLWVTVAAIAVVVLEWVALWGWRKVRSHREGWVNIASGAASFLPVFALSRAIMLPLMFALYERRLFDLGLRWWVWVLAYVGYDLLSFLVHLASHKVRLLWCLHSVHHAPKEMKASVSFRGSIGDFLVTPHTTLWLPLLGFHPLMIAVVEGLGMIYGVLLHLSDAYMPKREPGWLRAILITPSTHRLHHAKNEPYLDTNYALTFRLWDHLFGTAKEPIEGEEVEYGLTKELDAGDLWVSQTDELLCLWRDLRSVPCFLDKLGYLFMPPGWRPAEGRAQNEKEPLERSGSSGSPVLADRRDREAISRGCR